MMRAIATARPQVQMTQPHLDLSAIDAKSALQEYNSQVDAEDPLARNPRYHENSIVRESFGSLPE